MLNIAVASAFLLSLILPPAQRIVGLFIDLPALQIMPAGQRGTVFSLLAFWLPATLMYSGLRFVPSASRLTPTRSESVALAIGNLILVLYIAAKTFASTVEGGGASFVVASFSKFTAIPALILVGATLLKIIVRVAGGAASQVPSIAVPNAERIVIALVGFGPVVYALATLFISTGSPFQVSRAVERRMAELCLTAGEKVVRSPDGVEGIFLARDVAMRYGKIKHGTYGLTEGGILGEALVNSGLLRYFETPVHSRTKSASPSAAYERFFIHQQRQPVETLMSQYGVYRTKLTTADDAVLGTEGYEIAIKAIPSGEVLATNRYFFNRKTRRICGSVIGNAIDEGRFVRNALKLERRYESLRPKSK